MGRVIVVGVWVMVVVEEIDRFDICNIDEQDIGVRIDYNYHQIRPFHNRLAAVYIVYITV